MGNVGPVTGRVALAEDLAIAAAFNPNCPRFYLQEFRGTFKMRGAAQYPGDAQFHFVDLDILFPFERR